MSATASSAPCAFKRALRPSSLCTKARTGYPAFSISLTTTLPVFPVAPVTMILGLIMIVSFKRWFLPAAALQGASLQRSWVQCPQRHQGSDGNVLVIHQVFFCERQSFDKRSCLVLGLRVD